MSLFDDIVAHIRDMTSIIGIKELIDKDPEVMLKFDEKHMTLLDYCICFRGEMLIDELIKTYKPPLTFPVEAKHNPYIFHAYEHKKYNTLEVLLNNGADPNEKEENGIPLLNTAATDHDMKALNILLRCDRTDINITDSENCNAALHAAKRNHTNALIMLMHYKIDINCKDELGATPLMHAALANAYKCIKLLVENGVELNERDADGLTALNYASLGNDKQCIDYLVEHGAEKYIEYDDVKEHTTVQRVH